VTKGLGEFNGLDYLTAARSKDGSSVIAYMPSARTITVDMTQLVGHAVHASWMNPRTGKLQLAGRFSPTGSREFIPPGEGDWVLILDSAPQ
jgi:Putative collagen-binding domain of a collagenase